MPEKQQKAWFSAALLNWNKVKNDRIMPWKGEKDPYRIWMSEIILQQTRVEQGTAYSLMYEELTGIKIEQIVIIISVDHEDKPQEFIKNRNDYVDSLKNKIEAYKKEHSNVY